MSDDSLHLQSTTDAAVWTDEFFRLHGHRLADIDWGLMVSWFANAIEVGREAGRSSEAAKYLKPASEHDPRCPAALNYQAPCTCPDEAAS